MKEQKKCSDKELLGYIVKLSEDLAQEEHLTMNARDIKKGYIELKEPTAKQMNKAKGYPSIQVYIDRFGSWNQAKYLAGFTEKFENPWAYSREELVEYLIEETIFSREFATKLLSGTKKEKEKKKDN